MLVAILFAGNAVATEPGPTPASGNSLELYYGSWAIMDRSPNDGGGTFYLGKDAIKNSDRDIVEDYKIVMQDNNRIVMMVRSPNKNWAVYYFLMMSDINPERGVGYRGECVSTNIKKGSRGYALLQRNWEHISPDQIQKLFRAGICFVHPEEEQNTWMENWWSVDIERVKE